MTVEDKRLEKENRALHEPIFFYTSVMQIPKELVINKIDKKTISGYVSIPKPYSHGAGWPGASRTFGIRALRKRKDSYADWAFTKY